VGGGFGMGVQRGVRGFRGGGLVRIRNHNIFSFVH